MIVSEISALQQIPYAYSQSPKKMRAAIRWLCEYDFYLKYYVDSIVMRERVLIAVATP